MQILRTERKRRNGKITVRFRADAGIDPTTGKRVRKSCATYAAAKAWLRTRRDGESLDAAPAGSLTLAQLGAKFVADRKAAGRERSTYEKYAEHFEQHIKRLTYAHEAGDPDQDAAWDGMAYGDLPAQAMRPRHFLKLRRALVGSRSHAMALKVWSTLAATLDFGVQMEALDANLARSIKIDRRPRERAEKIAIPSRPEIATLIEATRPADGEPIYMGQAMIAVTLTAGLRPSEMRALTWPCLSVEAQPYRVEVAARVDQWGQSGPPKSAAGYREIPIPESTARLLREWKLKCPKVGQKNLVFPTSSGSHQNLSNIHTRIWRPYQVALGIADPKLDAAGAAVLDQDGAPLMVPRYSWYALRHAYASMQIAIGIGPKELQRRMGHASIQMTMDLYGHLWSDPGQDQADMAALDVFMKNLPQGQ